MAMVLSKAMTLAANPFGLLYMIVVGFLVVEIISIAFCGTAST